MRRRRERADIRVRDVVLTEHELSVALMDGRTISVPLVWYPRLADGTSERAHWEVAGTGFGIPLAEDRRGVVVRRSPAGCSRASGVGGVAVGVGWGGMSGGVGVCDKAIGARFTE